MREASASVVPELEAVQESHTLHVRFVVIGRELNCVSNHAEVLQERRIVHHGCVNCRNCHQ